MSSPALASLIDQARRRGASDLHLEPNLPPTVRVRGVLEMQGPPVGGDELVRMAQDLLGGENWEVFLAQRSFDLSATMGGVRCRFNVLKTARGVGMAIRLLAPFKATLERLNLHPDLRQLAQLQHGLVLVSGPTGCGKSSTVAALIQEINATKARHIITVESPIEHNLRSQLSLIRQREVGRDTPSFERALIDALREDPDVIVVGEMRDPETMRLTLNAAETGHLVFATVHSSSVGEALQRVVGAFSGEHQDGVRAQLADCFAAVLCQRLVYRPDLKIRVPECELLLATSGAKALLREGKFFKMQDVVMTGGGEGMWTFQRYRQWIDNKTNWYVGQDTDAAELADEGPSIALPRPAPATVSGSERSAPPAAASPGSAAPAAITGAGARPSPAAGRADRKPPVVPESMRPNLPPEEERTVINIDADEDLDQLVKELDKKK